MYELADISLFMKNCGQGQSGMSAFETVAVKNNQGGIDRFMSDEFKQGRCGALVRRVFQAIAQSGGVDENTGIALGMQAPLGDFIAGKIIRELGKYTIPAIRAHFDGKYELPTNGSNVTARSVEYPFKSDKIGPMLELGDIPQFAKELEVNMKAYYSEWYQENFGELPSKDMLDMCGFVADGVGQKISAEVNSYSGLGDAMVNIMKQYKQENGGVDISFEEFALDHSPEFAQMLKELGPDKAFSMVNELLNSISRGLHKGKTVEDMDEPELSVQDFVDNWPLSQVKNTDDTGELVRQLVDGLLKR